jgi:hypothetical protein
MVGRPPVVWRGRRRGADTGDVGSEVQQAPGLAAASAVQRRLAERMSATLSVSAHAYVQQCVSITAVTPIRTMRLTYCCASFTCPCHTDFRRCKHGPLTGPKQAPDEVLRRERAVPFAAALEPRPVRLRRSALPLCRSMLPPDCCPMAPFAPVPFCRGPSPCACSRVYRLLAGSCDRGVTSFPTRRGPAGGSLELRREVGCEAIVRRVCAPKAHMLTALLHWRVDQAATEWSMTGRQHAATVMLVDHAKTSVLTCGAGCTVAAAGASRPVMRGSGQIEASPSMRNSMMTSGAGRQWRLASGSCPSCTARWKTAWPMAAACADAMLASPAWLDRLARATKRLNASAAATSGQSWV